MGDPETSSQHSAFLTVSRRYCVIKQSSCWESSLLPHTKPGAQLPAGPTPTSTWEEPAQDADPSPRPRPGLRCCLPPDGIAAGTSRRSSLPGMKPAACLGSSCCICGLCYAKRVSSSFCLLPLRTALVAVLNITQVRLDPTWFPARPEGAR